MFLSVVGFFFSNIFQNSQNLSKTTEFKSKIAGKYHFSKKTICSMRLGLRNMMGKAGTIKLHEILFRIYLHFKYFNNPQNILPRIIVLINILSAIIEILAYRQTNSGNSIQFLDSLGRKTISSK